MAAQGAVAPPAPEFASGGGLERAQVRTLASLAAIALTLGVVVAVTVLPTLNAPPPKPGGRPLVAFDPARITGVAVRRGEIAAEFTRTADGWERRAGGRAERVDADRIDGFLTTLAALDRLSELSGDDLAPAEFGLDPPRGEVVLRGGAGDARIALGDRNPPLTALYVQVLPDPRIALVGSVLLWEFDKLASLAAAGAR